MTSQAQAQALLRLDQLYEQQDSFRIWLSYHTFVNCLLSSMSTNYTQIVCSCQEEMSHGSLEEEATAFL